MKPQRAPERSTLGREVCFRLNLIRVGTQTLWRKQVAAHAWSSWCQAQTRTTIRRFRLKEVGQYNLAHPGSILIPSIPYGPQVRGVALAFENLSIG